jgi:two-component system nitrogen regulation response regulator NtrX
MNQTPRQTILIIDDEPDIIRILKRILTEEDFDVVTAVNGNDGFEKIIGQDFAAVVCDLKMPVLDGISLLKKVRAENRLTPFIFLSGDADSRDEHEMINYGAYQLISKPFLDKVPDALRSMIKSDQEVKSLKNASKDAQEFLEILHETGKKI